VKNTTAPARREGARNLDPWRQLDRAIPQCSAGGRLRRVAQLRNGASALAATSSKRAGSVVATTADVKNIDLLAKRLDLTAQGGIRGTANGECAASM